mmetsp:Transcript_15069/g.39868  ORF Transcript_15069/g.39868 Transcript_15069/m.39868 type:complete len:277 (+) Transcript_15069:1502-2332(+)
MEALPQRQNQPGFRPVDMQPLDLATGLAVSAVEQEVRHRLHVLVLRVCLRYGADGHQVKPLLVYMPHPVVAIETHDLQAPVLVAMHRLVHRRHGELWGKVPHQQGPDAQFPNHFSERVPGNEAVRAFRLVEHSLHGLQSHPFAAEAEMVDQGAAQPLAVHARGAVLQFLPVDVLEARGRGIKVAPESVAGRLAAPRDGLLVPVGRGRLLRGQLPRELEPEALVVHRVAIRQLPEIGRDAVTPRSGVEGHGGAQPTTHGREAALGAAAAARAAPAGD